MSEKKENKEEQLEKLFSVLGDVIKQVKENSSDDEKQKIEDYEKMFSVFGGFTTDSKKEKEEDNYEQERIILDKIEPKLLEIIREVIRNAE